MYITILDYSIGMVHICAIPDNIDPEDFIINKGFNLSTINYIVTEGLNLNITI